MKRVKAAYKQYKTAGDRYSKQIECKVQNAKCKINEKIGVIIIDTDFFILFLVIMVNTNFISVKINYN